MKSQISIAASTSAHEGLAVWYETQTLATQMQVKKYHSFLVGHF